MANYYIDDVQATTEEQAKSLSEESIVIKGHTVYFVILQGYFNYSALVFKNGHHIYYADIYANSYPKDTCISELREKYIEKLNNTLFDDEDFTKPLSSYDEFQRKKHYLYNLFHQRADYVSQFQIIRTEEEREQYRNMISDLDYDPVGMCYTDDMNMINKHIELYQVLAERRTEMEKDYAYLKSAIKYEMYNHEYSINWQADYDVCSCFGTVTYKGNSANELRSYFEQLKFSATQRKAYLDARKEYYEEVNKADEDDEDAS